LYDLPKDSVHLSEFGRKEIQLLNSYLKEKYCEESTLYATGIFKSSNFNLIAIPTILVESPKMLVGLGDTISLIAVLFDAIKK